MGSRRQVRLRHGDVLLQPGLVHPGRRYHHRYLLPRCRHYIRILPAGDPKSADADPNTAYVFIKNRSDNSWFPARNIVDAGFLELVRYGIRPAGDPLFEDFLRVVDAQCELLLFLLPG
jgi:GH15 family glucan-1,4-alpha-glucosidase